MDDQGSVVILLILFKVLLVWKILFKVIYFEVYCNVWVSIYLVTLSISRAGVALTYVYVA